MGTPATFATSPRGMVTSPHTFATEAGLQVLGEGGNAVEAAIAMTFCLSVTSPHFCGLGGDLLMLIADAGGRVKSLSGIGQATQSCPRFNGPVPVRGPLSMLTSAAAVDALGQACTISASEMEGRMSWQSLLEPAIRLAAEGFPISNSERFWLEFRKSESMDLPGVYPARLVNGGVPPEGCLRREPVLRDLIARGHRISRVPANTPLMGHPGALLIDPATGSMTGAHDPRSDGRALGL